MNTTYKNLFNEILVSSLSSSQIYTDGSKTNTGFGIAIIKNDTSLSYKLLD